MPMYPCKCDKCGAVEVFAPSTQVHNLRCPECGEGPLEQDYAAKIGTAAIVSDALPANPMKDETLHGHIIDYDCHPSQVQKRREALNNYGLAHVYRDDGTCRVNSRSDMKSFGRARGEMLRRNQSWD